jgi:hypothetical protein
VRVLQVRRGLDLGQEALGAHHRGELGLEDLERDLPLVLQVVGQVDRRHAALAEFALDAIATFQGRVQALAQALAHVKVSQEGRVPPERHQTGRPEATPLGGTVGVVGRGGKIGHDRG